MATASTTGTEFNPPTSTRCARGAGASCSLREVRGPVTSYSLTPGEAVEPTRTNVSNPDGWGRRDDEVGVVSFTVEAAI